MDISSQLDIIKIENFKRKIKNELDYLKEDIKNLSLFINSSECVIEERIFILEKLLNKNHELNKNETGQQKKENIIAEIEKYTYRKQWNKLPSFHKNVKLKEFIKNNYGDGELQNEIIEKLSEYSNEGRINTKKYIIYDPNSEKILSMPCLFIDFPKKVYSIKIV